MSVTKGYGVADEKTAEAIKEELEKAGFIFDRFYKLSNGKVRFHYYKEEKGKE